VYDLPFDLLVDADGSRAKAFGVGTMPILSFIKRVSVLIGPDGKVVRLYDSVDRRRLRDRSWKTSRKPAGSPSDLKVSTHNASFLAATPIDAIKGLATR